MAAFFREMTGNSTVRRRADPENRWQFLPYLACFQMLC